jgi:uncharacterized membrane protein
MRRTEAGWRAAGLVAAVLALLLASCALGGLVALRSLGSGRLSHLFLLKNLTLAWLPLAFALLAAGIDARAAGRARIMVWGCAAAWLAFLPNAPYLLTDLLHLRVQGNHFAWLDLVILPGFGWLGVALGFASLLVMQRLWRERLGALAAWVGVACSTGLAAVGIYLGRFRRWNSWDLLTQPQALLLDAASSLARLRAAAFVLACTAFLLTAYLVFRALAGLAGSEFASNRRSGYSPSAGSA